MTRSYFGELPSGWRSVPTKHAASLNPEVLPESTPEDAELSYVDIAALEGGDASASLSPKELTFGTAPSRARRVLRAGDTILSTVRTYLKAVANFPAAPEGLVASTGFAVLRTNGILHPRFAYWAALSEPFIENVVAHSEGVSYPAINPSVLGSLHLPVPPVGAQERIANFLDEQTARIDALIAEKEKLLLRLGEYLDSQCTFLLTGAGVHGEKTSTGWRFLPEVPSHWSMCHLRWISKRVDVGIAEAATHAYADAGVPILRSTNIRPNSVEGAFLRVEPWFAERNASKSLYADDLVTVRTGYPGVTAVVPPDLHGCQCFTMLITTLAEGYLPEFYARYLNSAAARGYFEVESWGSAQKNISVPILKDAMVPRLPLLEQRDIVQNCRTLESSVKDLSSHVRAHVGRLREYRSSLISAAVTGQMDLSTFKPPADPE